LRRGNLGDEFRWQNVIKIGGQHRRRG
jgi:hypothetical protein